MGKTHGLQGENRSITNFSTELHSHSFPIKAGWRVYWLSPPPTISFLSPSASRDWTLTEEACFSLSPSLSHTLLGLLVGWIMVQQIVYCINVIQCYHFHFHVSSMSAPATIPPMPCLELFPPSLLALPFPHPPPSLIRPGPVLRFCQEIQTDRRVKRVSCRAAAAAAAAATPALLLRGCDLDNQEELERLQALEPLQLQQCQEGVSCVTQCPI